MSLWELKICRLVLQLLGMLGNVLGRPRHALQSPWPTLACFFKVLRVPHRRNPPPICCLISCEAKGVVYPQASIYEVSWYTTPLASQLIRQQMGGGGGFFDVGLLGPCKSMPRSAKDLAKHAEVGRGRCQACLGVAKQAYTS